MAPALTRPAGGLSRRERRNGALSRTGRMGTEVKRLVVMDIRLGDVVRLRKPHPCGGYDWAVVRLGADIGLRCLKCDHRVLLDRSVLERRIKQFVSRGDAPADVHNLAGQKPA